MEFLLSKFRRTSPDAAHTRLVPAIKSLICVLKEVDKYPALYLNQRVLRETIRRYEHAWIPLLANTLPSERLGLVPPLDVEWVWICHMLCPVKYASDSAAVWRVSRPDETDFLLDHKLLTENARRDGKKKAKVAWERQFPNEPFDIMSSIRDASMVENDVTDHDEQDGNPANSNISYDIALASGRQMGFCYQVADLPQYSDNKFLSAAVKRYRNKFLGLQQRFAKEVWVPTFDIDIAWHAHMLHPRWYKGETEALRGSVLAHDDTLTDRSPDSILNNRWEATKAKWSEIYGDSATRDGGNWRGYVEGAERALRPKVVSVIKDTEEHLKRSRGTVFSVWDEERKIDENLAGTDWVHRTDWRRANHSVTGSSDFERTVERYTFLAPSGERAPLLMCRTSHFLMCNMEGNPYTFCTTVEVYDRMPHVNNEGPRYPLATAHHALPQTICVSKRLKKNVCSLVPGETALVLRVGGEDFGLLCARWRDFRPPKDGVPAASSNNSTRTKEVIPIPGDPGDPGELTLRIWLLGEKSPGQWISLSRAGSRLQPASYSFRLPYRQANGVTVEDTVSFSLSDATVKAGNMKNIIPGYLICMASAALHVALQPRFAPRGGASPNSIETMYPAWGVRQKNYGTLRGAGGEVFAMGRNVGLSVMRHSMVLKNRGSTGFFAASVDDIGAPNTAAAE